MKKVMSAKQLTYAAALFIIASNLLTKSLYPYTKNETWISVVIATVASLIIIAIYGKLAQSYPKRSLFEINEAVFGVVGGKALSAVYVFFFLSLTVFNTRDLGDFVHSFVLPTTPLSLIYVAFLAICAYAVRKGAVKMTYYSPFILFIYLILVVILTSLMVPKIQFENLRPVFQVPLKNQLMSANLLTMLPFSEVFVFFVMVQYVEERKNFGKALRRALLIGAGTILFIVLRDIVMLGGFTLYTSSPTFGTIRLIDVGDILTRLEIINAALQITMLFFKVSILMYATITGLGKLFSVKDERIFTLSVGVLVVVCANFFFASPIEHSQWFRVAAIYSLFFLLILPLLTLLVSMIRKTRDDKGSVDVERQA